MGREGMVDGLTMRSDQIRSDNILYSFCLISLANSGYSESLSHILQNYRYYASFSRLQDIFGYLTALVVSGQERLHVLFLPCTCDVTVL